MKNEEDRVEIQRSDDEQSKAVFYGMPALAVKHGLAMHFLEGARRGASSIMLTGTARGVVVDALDLYCAWLVEQMELRIAEEEP